MSEQTDVETLISERLAEREKAIELIAVERSGNDVLRVYVDHPDGVTVTLCERVTGHLSDLLEDWSLEVSSPGPERPLTRPEHFRRFLGRRVRVRTSKLIDGQRNFIGELVAADEEKIALACEGDATGNAIEIPLERIGRSNLAPNIQGGTA